jgi:cobalt-zinc-cadmium efflux system membrane fusion protein
MEPKPQRGLPARAFILALLAASSLAGCSHEPKGDAATPSAASVTPQNVKLTAAQLQHVGLYTVASGRFHRTIETTGVVDFDNDQATSVLAPFSGPVAQILVAAGDKVKKGDALATVDSPDFATAIGAYGKALAVARTDRKLADADAELLRHNGVAQREAQQAETDAVSAESDRDTALQALVALGVDAQTIKAVEQGRTPARVQGVIRAPIAGTVAEKLITPGQLLQAGTTPSFTVADLSRVWVMAQIAEADQNAVTLGDAAEVGTDASPTRYTGKIGNISALVNPDTRSVIARVMVDNPGGTLKKQMYVRVRIQAKQETSGLLVPVAAVLRDDENMPFVYVVQPDGGFARQQVTLGVRNGDQYDITSGLQAGARIVADGGIFVQFMQSQ